MAASAIGASRRALVVFLFLIVQTLQGQGFTAPSRLTALSTMRRRNITGGAVAASKEPHRPAEMDENDDNVQVTEQAVDSMKFCYKYAFFAGVVGIFAIFIEGDFGHLDLLILARLSVVLHQFVYGSGLYRVWKINTKFSSDPSSIGPASFGDLTRTMGRMWQETTAVVILGSAALSMTVPSPVPRPWLVVLVLAIVGTVPLNMAATRACKEAEKAGNPAAPDYADVRTMGFSTSRNMRLCMGAFCLLGLVQIVTSLSSSSHIQKGLGLVDVAESWAIAGLIDRLNRDSLQSLVNATDANELKAADYVSIHYAEKDYYEKIGGVFQSQAAAKAFALIAAVIKPFVSAMTA